jgi:hypothetical protein
VGTEGTQHAVAYSDGWIVAHRMRIRLTVRYHALDPCGGQELFMARSNIRRSSNAANWHFFIL